LNSIYGLPNWDPLWSLRQEAVVCERSAKDSSHARSKKTEFTDANAKGNVTEQVQNSKDHHILPTFTHP
jgi:hypothetical protein